MGWLICDEKTRTEIIQERIADRHGTWSDGQKAIWRTLHHTVRGNALWKVETIVNADNGTEIARFIACDLLCGGKKGGGGYKDICESMGPAEKSCPIAYLDMVPVANAEWREDVRAEYARKNRKLSVGQTVKLVHATIPEVTITSLKPLCGTYQGRQYRIPRRLLAEEVTPATILRDKLEQEAHEAPAPYETMAAFGSWHVGVPNGMVVVFAGRGGRHKNGSYPKDTAHFQVPEAEYAARKGTFIVDEARHPRIEKFYEITNEVTV